MKNELKSWSMIGVSGAITVAILGLLGYLPGLGVLSSIREDYIPMAPSTAISFIGLGFVLLILNNKQLSRSKVIISLIVTLLVSLFGILEVAGHFSGICLNLEDTLVPDAGTLNGIPIARMSPATGAAFFLAGVAVFLLILQRKFPERNTIIEYFGGGLGILVLLISFVFCLAYVYGTPLLYGHGTTIPMALTTAVGFMFLSISVLTARRDAFPLRLLAGTSARSYLLRFILPLSTLSVVFGGVAVLSLTQTSAINPAFISAALTVLIVVITGFVANLIPRYMAGAIDRAEAAAKKANEALGESEAQFGKAISYAPVPIMIHAEDGEVLRINNIWTELTGYTHSDIPTINEWISKAYGKRIDDAQSIIDAIFVRNTIAHDGEVAIRIKSGQTKTWDFSSGPLGYLPDGRRLVISIATDVTERKIDEKNLRQSEERFRKLAETAFEGFVIVDKDRFLEVSPEFARLFGYEPSELIGMAVLDLVAPDYRDLVMENILNDYEKPYEAVGLRKDRSTFRFEAHGIKTPYHGITARLTAIRDITERKQAKEALHESAKRLQDLADFQPALIWGAGTGALRNYVNKTWLEFTGRTFEQELGNGWAEGVHKDDLERCLDIYQSAFKARIPFEMEYRLRRANGKYGWIFDRGVPQYDLKKEFIGYIGTCMDITEHKQTEDLLQRSNLSLMALSAVNAALVRIDKESTLLQKVCRIITDVAGYRLAWVGFAEHDEAKTIRPVAQAGYEDGYLETANLTWADTEWGQGPMGAAIRTGKSSIIRNIMGDSHYAQWRDLAVEQGFCSVIALPLNDKGTTFGVLNIYAREEDAFSEREKGFLQELADDLAFGIVNLRTLKERHQLNKQLRQAQKMEAIGQLTGGIAHDFNNILSAILGFTNLALMHFVKDDQPELRDYLNEVLRAGERACDLVSQMMVFSRTGSGKTSILELPPIINEVTKMLHVTLPSSIKLSNKIDEGVPAVMMEPVQLQQVLMNMCINARDAIGNKGCINIRLRRVNIIHNNQGAVESSQNDKGLRHICDSCHNVIEAGDYVELSVQDTGAGISKDKLKNIFEPFFTTKEVGKGTGMGLSMAHGIIHQYGGHILVDTELGVGTMFQVLLPARENVPNTETEIESGTNSITESLHDTRLLIVDDEESVARFMKDLLESHGSTVTVRTDSDAAFDLFSQDPAAFDLMITDQTMPGLTGVELAQKVLSLRPEFPVILCTGYSEQVDEAKAKALGIRGYLTKPMEVNTIITLVGSLIV